MTNVYIVNQYNRTNLYFSLSINIQVSSIVRQHSLGSSSYLIYLTSGIIVICHPLYLFLYLYGQPVVHQP